MSEESVPAAQMFSQGFFHNTDTSKDFSVFLNNPSKPYMYFAVFSSIPFV